MRLKYILLSVIVIVLASCKKQNVDQVPPIPLHNKHILLKDITVPNLPAPYYHFEYNSDSLVTKANFASGFTNYDVLYAGDRILEMQNNIIVNHDTLRYVYDNAGKITSIKFINSDNVLYRNAYFTYSGNLIKEISWDRKQQDGRFLTDRTLSFSFYADGNVHTIAEHRPAMPGVEDYISLTTFEQYDDKTNVDDFSLIHDGFHDHLFLLQGFRLQKNNPGKEILSVNGTNLYTVDYTYTYDNDNTPSDKAGNLLYLSGQYAGRSFQTNTFYTYY
jgi:hypothetical protein